MNDEMKKNILNEIETTGYPTELKVASKLRLLGLPVHENKYYIDRDMNKGREIDLETSIRHIIEEDGLFISFRVILNVEIKKSKKPWIIFTSPKNIFDHCGYALLNHHHNIDNKILRASDITAKHSKSRVERIGRTEHIPFTKDNPQIFTAILSSVKASIEDHYNAREHKEIHNDDSYDFTFYVPLIILDGELLDVFLDDDNNLELVEKNHILYRFNYQSPSYDEDSYMVDIIRIDEIDNFIVKQKEWLEHMANVVKTKINFS